MARGYPDYFGTSIWPKYGTPIYSSAEDTAASGADKDILTVSGQGVLVWYEAEIYNPPSVLTGSKCQITVDGSILRLLDCNQYSASAYPVGNRSLMIISYLDFILLDAMFTNGIEIPFKTGFTISLINTDGLDDQKMYVKTVHYVVT